MVNVSGSSRAVLSYRAGGRAGDPLSSVYALILAVGVRRGSAAERSASLGEEGRVSHSQLRQPVVTRNAQHTKAVNDAAPEANRRCFSEIRGRASHLGNIESEEGGLNQNFVVEYEIVGVFAEW